MPPGRDPAPLEPGTHGPDWPDGAPLAHSTPSVIVRRYWVRGRRKRSESTLSSWRGGFPTVPSHGANTSYVPERFQLNRGLAGSGRLFLLSGSFVMPGVRWDGAGGWGWGNSGGSAPPHGGGVERGSVGDTWAGSPFGRSSAALELNGPERFAAQGTTDNINDMPFFTPGGTDGRTDARTHGRTDGRTDGRRERETEGRKGGSVTV